MIARTLFLLLLGSALAANADPRQVADASSPSWLLAVGTLTVPGVEFSNGERSQRDENCTASLIGERTVLTAWHCFEYYRDLSREVIFTLPRAPGKPHQIVHRLADGGGMQADWALLRLQKAITDVTPLPIETEWSYEAGLPLIMAGYSRDNGLGDGGANLTWQAGCKNLADEWIRIATDCLAFKGASGGPVLGASKVVGVISAGDAKTITYYAPTRSFRSALRLHLN